MEELLKVLQDACPAIDFTASDALVDDGIVDSLDLVTIVTALMDAYDAEISVDDLVPENFNSLGAIYELIERTKG